MIISHDRTFLDNVVTRIIELDRGKLTTFPGNYAAYETQRPRSLSSRPRSTPVYWCWRRRRWIQYVEARRTGNEAAVPGICACSVKRAARNAGRA